MTTPQRYLVRVLEVTDPWRVFVCRDLVACLSRCCPAGETRCPPPFDWRSITTAPRHARPQPIDQIVKRARFDRFGSLWPVYKPNTPIKQHHHTTHQTHTQEAEKLSMLLITWERFVRYHLTARGGLGGSAPPAPPQNAGHGRTH